MRTSFDIQLTPNFNLSEFVNTSHSDFETLTYQQFNNIYELALILQSIRDEFKTPIYINSGFRSKLVNKKVAGAPNSYHLLGLACDFTTRNSDIDSQIFVFISKRENYSELIKYPTFIHLAI